jgi:O-antigen/teichoic acid export membrane protein
MTVNNDELNNKVVHATKWSSISEIAAKIISPVTNMILARILAPEAFGVVATVTMVTSFADMFTDSGFQKYLIQHEFTDDDEKYRYANVAFGTNLSISILLLIIIAVFRAPIAVMVGNPGLGDVIAIACLQLILTSFSSIQIALHRRDFDFKTLFWVRIVGVCLPFVVTIPLSLIGFGYWALIIGMICVKLSNAIILTVKSKWKPKWFFDFKILKKMFSFSMWSLIESVSIWLTSWIDIFIIGSVLNEYYLGLYKTSITMVNALMVLVTSSIQPVLFSALSRLQDDDASFNRMYFRVQKVVSIFIFPLGAGVFLYSDLATKVMLGSQWAEASGIIATWSLTSAIVIVFGHFCGEVYRAKGKPKVSLLAQMMHLIVLAPVCVIFSKYGFWPLVYARSWIRIEAVLVHFIIMKCIIKFPIASTFKNVAIPAASTLAMSVLAYLLRQVSGGIAWDIASILICACVYLGLLYLFPSTRQELSGIIKRIKPRRC